MDMVNSHIMVDIMKVKRMDKNSEEEVEEDKEEDTIQEIETDKNLEEEEEEELEDRTLLMKENIIKISKMMVNNSCKHAILCFYL